VNYGDTILPFGKYRGHTLAGVPPNYLIWLLKSCANLDQYLRDAVSRFLRDKEFQSWQLTFTITNFYPTKPLFNERIT